MKPTHFDLTVKNLDEAMTFFGKILGWKFDRFPTPYPYFLIHAGADTEAGINGGIGAIADAPAAAGLPTTQITIPIADLDATIKDVVESGGRIIEGKMPIVGVGWYATCAEPGGLKFGLIQEDANAS
jgi:predicted enzyme related to lactoylglutathione lyase